MKKVLVPSHPELEKLQRIDYKVRILDPESVTAAATRVMIEFKDTRSQAKKGQLLAWIGTLSA